MIFSKSPIFKLTRSVWALGSFGAGSSHTKESLKMKVRIRKLHIL